MSIWGDPRDALFRKTNSLEKQEKQLEILAMCSHYSYGWNLSDSQGCKYTSWCPCTRGFFLPLVSPNLKGMAIMEKMSICPEGAEITLKGINDRAYRWTNLSTYWSLVAWILSSYNRWEGLLIIKATEYFFSKPNKPLGDLFIFVYKYSIDGGCSVACGFVVIDLQA